MASGYYIVTVENIYVVPACRSIVHTAPTKLVLVRVLNFSTLVLVTLISALFFFTPNPSPLWHQASLDERIRMPSLRKRKHELFSLNNIEQKTVSPQKNKIASAK